MPGPADILITPPQGFVKPQSEGPVFDLVDTWELTPDGRLRLIQLGDTKIGANHPEPPPPRPSYEARAKMMSETPMNMAES